MYDNYVTSTPSHLLHHKNKIMRFTRELFYSFIVSFTNYFTHLLVHLRIILLIYFLVLALAGGKNGLGKTLHGPTRQRQKQAHDQAEEVRELSQSWQSHAA